MRNRILIGFVLAVMAMGWTGCCNSPDTYHYPIPTGVMALIPYNGTSTFHLRISTGKIVRVTAISENRSEFEVDPCNSCCKKEFQDQYFIYFQADSGGFQATIQVTQTGTEGVFAPARLSVTVNTNGVYYADFQPNGACELQDGMSCMDSLVVAGRTYRDVFELRNHSSNQTAAYPDRLYYNASDGILKVTTYGGMFYELVH
jgi:hypothetical protein